MSKSSQQLSIEGSKLRTYRKLLKLKQYEAAKLLNAEQGNYCRMEQGRLNAGARLDKLAELFKEWRKGEIRRLEQRITYLKSL